MVLLDIVMPKLDGLAVMDRVSHDPAMKKDSEVYRDIRHRD